MKTEIYSFEEIEKRAEKKWEKDTALISIGDPGMDEPKLKHKPEHIFRVEFDDIMPDEDEEGVRITREMAKSMADFINMCVKNGTKQFVCQCEYGQSRSAGVAAAIKQHFDGDGISVFADYNYYPNKLVYNLVYEELERIN